MLLSTGGRQKYGKWVLMSWAESYLHSESDVWKVCIGERKVGVKLWNLEYITSI